MAILDIGLDRDFVLCTLPIREVGTCELRIPRDRYDPWAILDAMQRTQ